MVSFSTILSPQMFEPIFPRPFPPFNSFSPFGFVRIQTPSSLPPLLRFSASFQEWQMHLFFSSLRRSIVVFSRFCIRDPVSVRFSLKTFLHDDSFPFLIFPFLSFNASSSSSTFPTKFCIFNPFFGFLLLCIRPDVRLTPPALGFRFLLSFFSSRLFYSRMTPTSPFPCVGNCLCPFAIRLISFLFSRKAGISAPPLRCISFFFL